MSIKIQIALLLAVSLQACCNNETATVVKESTEVVAPVENKILVVSHRGDWRNSPENSLQAIENCIEMGVDVVEIDIHKTKDGELVLMHDHTIDRTTTGKGKVSDWTLDSLRTLTLKNGVNHPTHHKIPTLEEALLVAKGRIRVNLDKCYNYFDEAYEIMQKTGTVSQVIMKGTKPYAQVKLDLGDKLDSIVYMPIVDLGSQSAWSEILKFQEQANPEAFELNFSEDTSSVLNRFAEIESNGSKVWVNSLWESLNAGYEDDMALMNPDSVYGWFVEKGVDIIQTDRPQLLLDYLRKEGLHK